ncbi:MAG TPA: MotA/TolQ/ExbB proton channel family protein [Opitutus sp.]|nr:MotA/TolQ/ExbB proton channel family protein [Opitutus sp.]
MHSRTELPAGRTWRWVAMAGLLGAALGTFAADEADPIAKVAEQANTEFTQRLEAATRELTATRERIATEKAPLLAATQAAEDQIIALGPEIAVLQSAHADAEARRQKLESARFNAQKNVNYLNTLARDSLRSVGDAALPGESRQVAEGVAELTRKLDSVGQKPDATPALDTVEFMLHRFREQLGGHAVAGESLVGEGNQMVPGTFVFLGPEVFFQSQDGKVAGTVRTREGSDYPITYPLVAWDAAKATPFFHGQPGAILADASGGKALRLRETTGTVLQHVERGGPVAYIIIGVGFVALGMALQKFFELSRLQVDSPATVQALLEVLLELPPEEQRKAVARLKRTTRDLFETGLRHLDKPKEALEEHLFAFTLRTRLHYERRLPLLAVIATASPLMGLLGTVMGMIKTFALITVFGTGNAAKLSSGISEVLVTTELGLTVAVPTLIAHGYLSHRAQKKLSLLERYAVEFVAATGDAGGAEATSDTRGPEPAGEELSV